MYLLPTAPKVPFMGSIEQLRLRVVTTRNGFDVVFASRNGRDIAHYGEAAFKILGTMLIPAGGMALILPTIVEGTAQLAVQASFLMAFVLTGIALHRWADKGFRRRIQVDGVRGEVRIGTVNSENKFSLVESYPVSDIESFFIVRATASDAPCRLKMRLKVGSGAKEIVRGPERALVPVLERITGTLRPPKMRGRRVQTKTTGQFIRATFE